MAATRSAADNLLNRMTNAALWCQASGANSASGQLRIDLCERLHWREITRAISVKLPNAPLYWMARLLDGTPSLVGPSGIRTAFTSSAPSAADLKFLATRTHSADCLSSTISCSRALERRWLKLLPTPLPAQLRLIGIIWTISAPQASFMENYGGKQTRADSHKPKDLPQFRRIGFGAGASRQCSSFDRSCG